nr:SURF1 family protein [Shewanella sp. WXL01]
MNMSSSTNTNLTMNGVVTGSPWKRYGWSIVAFILITVAVFSALVKLGLWQLDRAKQKQTWQQTLSERQQQRQLSYSEILAQLAEQQADEFSLLSGYQLALTATPVNEQILLLDNQVYQGQVGYLVFQLLTVSPSQPRLLLELGFVAGSKDRRILPSVQPLPIEQVELTGRVYQKQINPMSQQLQAEMGNPLRFQNLNIAELSELLQTPIANLVLQPNSLANQQLPQPWQPIPLGAQKHQGYALQWFTMAAVFLSLMLWLAVRFIRKQQVSVNKKYS